MIENRQWYSFEITKLGMNDKMEIDYDKLSDAIAKAIVKVQIDAKNSKEIHTPIKVTFKQFIHRIFQILRNEVDTQDNMTIGTFAMPVYVILKLVSILGFVLSFTGVILFVFWVFGLEWSDFTAIALNILQIVFTILVLFFLFIYSLMMWGAANEIDRENDKNFVVSVFSGLVSFAALIVSLVALLRGGCGC